MKLWEGNVLTGVCLLGEFGISGTRSLEEGRVGISGRKSLLRGRYPVVATKAGGTHLTGMLSCSFYTSIAPFFGVWRTFSAFYIVAWFPFLFMSL